MVLKIATLVFVVGTRPPVAANSMALAMERSSYAGPASAIIGAGTFGGVLVATPLLAVLPFDVGMSMAVTMAVCSVLALISTVVLARSSAVAESRGDIRVR